MARQHFRVWSSTANQSNTSHLCRSCGWTKFLYLQDADPRTFTSSVELRFLSFHKLARRNSAEFAKFCIQFCSSRWCVSLSGHISNDMTSTYCLIAQSQICKRRSLSSKCFLHSLKPVFKTSQEIQQLFADYNAEYKRKIKVLNKKNLKITWGHVLRACAFSMWKPSYRWTENEHSSSTCVLKELMIQ